MKRGSSVVVGTDLSEAADEAIRQGDRRARDFERELVVCHFVPDVVRNNPLFPQLNEPEAERALSLERAAGDAVSARVAELTGRSPDQFRVVVGTGRADAGLLDEAEAANATLVVVGSRGMTGLTRAVLGSVAERVAEHAHVSVLVARPHVPGGRVLAASDFSALGNAAIGAAADVARRSGRGLTVMHSLDVFPAPALGAGAPFGASWVTLPETTLRDVRKAADATLRQELQANQTTGEALVADGPAVVTIVRAAESLPADVIVLGTKGHSTLRRLLLGTVAASVIRHAHCSVLIVRRDAAPAA